MTRDSSGSNEFWKCDSKGGDGRGDLSGDLLMRDLEVMSEARRKYPDQTERLDLFLMGEKGGRR
jgi:hypothetical protein